MSSRRDALYLLSLPTAGDGAVKRDAAAAAVARLTARLASAELTLRDINHALAHDLRTSLRHVASYAQLLVEPAHAAQPEVASRLSGKVVNASRRLERLMQSTAALARLQSADLRLQAVDTGALVRGLVQALAQRAGQAGATHKQAPAAVTCVVPPDLPIVQADAELLQRVWQELLDNAWRHAMQHAAPRVEVAHEAVPGGQAFFVHDNGPGFEPGQAGALFGLFQGAPGAPLPGLEAGLGLGLALVRRMVECHGGRVWASARPGQGASFGFSLPVRAG